ncbi:MAG: hypothetical protein JWQ08_1433, partial [Deinococcus sp.]|nr:hypothetical protein [Deinococcus sp.]
KSLADNPRWSMVDVSPVAAFPTLLTLDALRGLPEWADSPLTSKGTRLSVIPVTQTQFRAALAAVGLTPEELEMGVIQTANT